MINLCLKKGNDWLVGVSNDFKDFKALKKISRLKDICDFPGYITFKKYIKDEKLKIDEKAILKDMGASSIYILNEPWMEETKEDREQIERIEKEWWKDYCKYCKGCKNDCKQSFMAEVLFCRNYKKKTK